MVGKPAVQGRVEAPDRPPSGVHAPKWRWSRSGKAAVTHYRVLRTGNGWSLVHCRLETGRTHQIRVHMRSIGHPLLGDPTYGRAKLDRALPEMARSFPRQALHAARLEFIHPASGERLAFDSAVPSDLERLLSALDQHG